MESKNMDELENIQSILEAWNNDLISDYEAVHRIWEVVFNA
jgi:hypothetical protein